MIVTGGVDGRWSVSGSVDKVLPEGMSIGSLVSVGSPLENV